MDSTADTRKISTTQTSGGRALQNWVLVHVLFVSVLMTLTFAGGILLWLRRRKKLQQYGALKWIQRKRSTRRHRMRERSSVMAACDLQALEEAREAQNTQAEAVVAESDEDTDVESVLVEVHKPFTSCPPGARFLRAVSRSRHSLQSARNESPERDSWSIGQGRGRRRGTDAPEQESSDSDEGMAEGHTSTNFNIQPKSARRKSSQKLTLVKDTSAEKNISSWMPCSSLLAGVKTRADKNAYSSQPETSDSDDNYYSEVQDGSWTESLSEQRRRGSLSCAMPAKSGGYQKPTPASIGQAHGSACNSPATALKINSTSTSRSGFCTIERPHHYPAKSPDKQQQKHKNDSAAKRDFCRRLLQSDYSEVDDYSDAEPEGLSNLQGELSPTRLTFSGSRTSSDSHYSEVYESDIANGTSTESIDIFTPRCLSCSESGTEEFEVDEGDESQSSVESDGNYYYSEINEDYVNEAKTDDDSGDDTVKIGCRAGGWKGHVGVRPSLGDVGCGDDEKATVRHCGEDCNRPVITEPACRQSSRGDVCRTQVERIDPAAETHGSEIEDNGDYVNARSERLCCVSADDDEQQSSRFSYHSRCTGLLAVDDDSGDGVSNYLNLEKENHTLFQSDGLATATTSVGHARRDISPSTAKSASHGNYLTPASGPGQAHDGEMDGGQDNASINSDYTCTDTEEGQLSTGVKDTRDLCVAKGDRNRAGDEDDAEENETSGGANYMNLEEEFDSTNSLISRKLSEDKDLQCDTGLAHIREESSVDKKCCLKHTIQKPDATCFLFQQKTKVQILGQKSAAIPLPQPEANSRVSHLNRDTNDECTGGMEAYGHFDGKVPLETSVSTPGTSRLPDEPVASDYSESDYQNFDTNQNANDYFNNSDLRSAVTDKFLFSSCMLGQQARRLPEDTGFCDKGNISDATSISTESDDANGFEDALGRLDSGGVGEVVTNFYTILK